MHWHDEALRGQFNRFQGQTVNSTGDGFFVAFDTSEQALACAVAIQRELAEHRRATGFATMVRIGVHTADANRHGDDYSGVGVHVAARVAALAGGGEIITTVETLDGARDFSFSEPREEMVKGVADPIKVASITWD
ncbi:MAG: adenylate/guanylate cyclase domain-containing protein [Acidimicrobiia bacterium]|nr:adenylate/guanylate cyclase domain-containing protein [Acidimicrobiia bacterium]